MNTLLMVLIALVAIFLILIVLLQEPKEGGISAVLSSVSQFGGVQKTTNFLEKTTWTLFIFMIVLSIVKVGWDKKNKVKSIVPVEQSLPSEQIQPEELMIK
jgi:preprotein translocase subunit SecG